jgi:hypothetical protein
MPQNQRRMGMVSSNPQMQSPIAGQGGSFRGATGQGNQSTAQFRPGAGPLGGTLPGPGGMAGPLGPGFAPQVGAPAPMPPPQPPMMRPQNPMPDPRIRTMGAAGMGTPAQFAPGLAPGGAPGAQGAGPLQSMSNVARAMQSAGPPPQAVPPPQGPPPGMPPQGQVPPWMQRPNPFMMR